MQAFTFEQVQTSFQQAIDFLETGKALTFKQDGQPTAMLFSFKEGSELLRLRHTTRLDDFYAKQIKSLAQSAPVLSMDDINKLIDELRT